MALTVICAFALALMPAAVTPARALTLLDKLCEGYISCMAQGLGDGGYSSANRSSYWRMSPGPNSPNYVALREIQNGAPAELSYSLGDANNWGTAAAAHGVVVDSTPAVGAVAWFAGSTAFGNTGHVAYVEAIDGTKVTVSEGNWDGSFDWRQYYLSDVSGFIHFADVAGSSPFGALEVVSSKTPGVIHVKGWAADPDAPSGPLTVHVHANGQIIGIIANAYRPDLPKALGAGYGNYLGYEADLQFQRTGDVTVCAFAINLGLGSANTRLGCKTIQVVSPQAFGSLDIATDLGGHRVRVAGWAADANKPAGPLKVSLVANGTAVGQLTANTHRPDVRKAIGAQYGDHLGFDSVITVPTSGTTRICAYAVNVGPGWSDSALGCKTITISHKLTGPVPTISGTAKAGKRLTCKPGTWAPSGVRLGYQWLRDGKPITGAKAATYKLTKTSVGKRISVTVTGHKATYPDLSRTSAKTGKVKK